MVNNSARYLAGRNTAQYIEQSVDSIAQYSAVSGQ
jgi:hypothetical protein